MSMLDTYRRNVTNKRDALAKLSAEKARESDKIARANKKLKLPIPKMGSVP